MPVRRLVLWVVLPAMLMAASPGLRPRATATDYAARQSTASFEVGAVRIPASDVKKMFAADLNRAGYIVVEVGIYPVAGADVDITPAAFTLRTDSGRTAARIVDTDAIAAEIARERVPSQIRSSDGFRATGSGGVRGRMIPPAADGQQSGSVLGGEVEDYPPPSTFSKLGAVEQELWEKSLPDGKTHVPVAGYLYFPKPPGKTSNDWELLIDTPSTRLKLTLQDAGRH